VGAFERGDDAFRVGEFLEGGERLVVGGVGVFDAADVLEIGVLGADGGVVESGGNGVGEFDLGDEPADMVSSSEKPPRAKSLTRQRKIDAELNLLSGIESR
jgi:hypothetical protein